MKIAPKSKIYRNQEFFINCCRSSTASEAREQWKSLSSEDRKPYVAACNKHNAEVRLTNRDE